jgi:hypothetical protein
VVSTSRRMRSSALQVGGDRCAGRAALGAGVGPAGIQPHLRAAGDGGGEEDVEGGAGAAALELEHRQIGRRRGADEAVDKRERHARRLAAPITEGGFKP